MTVFRCDLRAPFINTTIQPHAGTLGHINTLFLFKSVRGCVSTAVKHRKPPPCAHTMLVTLSLSLLDSLKNMAYCPDCIYSSGNDLRMDTGLHSKPLCQTETGSDIPNNTSTKRDTSIDFTGGFYVTIAAPDHQEHTHFVL